MQPAYPASSPQSHPPRVGIVEALYAVCVAWILYSLAMPLADLPLPHARIEALPKWLPGPPTTIYSLVAFMLPELVLVGWLALAASRLGGPASTPMAATVGVWCVWLKVRLQVWGAALPSGWLAIALVALVLVAVAGAAYARRRGTPVRRFRPARSPLVYPGFALLCGLGAIWLLDFFATSYPSYWRGGFAQRQLGWLQLAFCLLTLVAATAPTMLESASRLVANVEGKLHSERAGLVRVTLGFVAAAWFAGVLMFVLAAKSAGQPVPATASELVRVPLWCALAWLGYRWGDQVPRAPRILGPALLVVGICFALLAAIGDAGQVLLNLAVLAVYANAVALCWRLRRGWSRAIAVIVGSAILLVAIGVALTTVGPSHGPQHVALRIAATQDPFHAHDPYLAQLRWFGAEAGLRGFGIGAIPWCGYMGTMFGECVTGVPRQTPSDYSYFGLVGAWGLAGACAVVLCLVVWLLALARSALPRSALEAQAVSQQLLAAWLTGVFASAMLVQAFLTIFGALGSFPMTGVALPLLSLGGSGLAVAAVFSGLAASALTTPTAAASTLKGR